MSQPIDEQQPQESQEVANRASARYLWLFFELHQLDAGNAWRGSLETKFPDSWGASCPA